MDSRAEARQPAGFEVSLVDLANPDQTISGRTLEVSPSGIRVLVPVRVAPETPVRLEIGGHPVFGIAVYSNPDGEQFQVGIEITQVLFEESDLLKLQIALLAEENPAPKKNNVC